MVSVVEPVQAVLFAHTVLARVQEMVVEPVPTAEANPKLGAALLIAAMPVEDEVHMPSQFTGPPFDPSDITIEAVNT